MLDNSRNEIHLYFFHYQYLCTDKKSVIKIQKDGCKS